MSLDTILRLIIMLSGLGLLVFGGFLLGWQLQAEAQGVCIRGSGPPCSVITPGGFELKTQYAGHIVIGIGAILQVIAMIGISKRKVLGKGTSS
jgi:hypothetical protein